MSVNGKAIWAFQLLHEGFTLVYCTIDVNFRLVQSGSNLESVTTRTQLVTHKLGKVLE